MGSLVCNLARIFLTTAEACPHDKDQKGCMTITIGTNGLLICGSQRMSS